jgi:mitochondrial enoyl-[acyl-carrier protein] reductase / trans-2-enoyl-CoA reductase
MEKEETQKVQGKDVLVKMLAAPINPADLNIIEGNYGKLPKLPAFAGSEGVGVVEQVGSEVSNLKVGQRVIPSTPGLGTWRNHIVSSENNFSVVSSDIPIEYASVIAVNPCTAYRLLKDFSSLKPGDVIIQNAASSMVGHAVVQIAKSMGVKTVSIIRSRPEEGQMVERLKLLGGDIVVTEEYASSHHMTKLLSDLPKPKLAFNAVGGNSVRNLAKHLGESGTIVTYGGMSRQAISVSTSPFIFNDLTMKGFWLSRWVEKNSKEAREKMISEVATLMKEKKLTLFMEKHKFSDFSTALEASQQPFQDRKIILDFQ